MSHRFNEASRDPKLWPNLRVHYNLLPTGDRWQRFLRWLSRRAGGIETLVFGESAVRSTVLSLSRSLFAFLKAVLSAARNL